MLAGKRIVVGVTGGIAAYKSALLVRDCIKAGAEVQVVMTQSAATFITPLTLATLSRRDVLIDQPGSSGELHGGHWTRHIDLGQWADIMIIAPATANTLAKLACGLADNFLTTLVLALRCPLILAPAMDRDMYLHPATQHNLQVLRQRGCEVIEPDSGDLASGLSGAGRLPDPAELVRYLADRLSQPHQDFAGRRVLITAGPTQEAIDPVRYVGNRSSGKMGFAIARAAASRGAAVTLVSGPVALTTPPGVRRIDVVTAQQMADAVERSFTDADVLVMAAAVADFSPAEPQPEKLKRSAIAGETLTLVLRKNPDILAAVAARKERRIVVGFALETTNGEAEAQRKLEAKHLDLIVLNNPLEQGAAFGEETNIVTLIGPGGPPERLPQLLKFDVANKILDRIRPRLG